MNTHKTFHETVVRSWEIFQPKGNVSRKERTKAMREVVRRAMSSLDDNPTVATLDFRSDHVGGRWSGRWSIEQPIQIGSGRAVEWCHIAYLWYACIARLVHDRLGWSGQAVRETAKALVRRGNFENWVPRRALPIEELLRALRIKPSLPYQDGIILGYGDTPIDPKDAHCMAWLLWYDRVVSPAWGNFLLDHYVARLKADPAFRTPGMVVGEIRRLRGADVTDFRGCSGGEPLIALAGRPEIHDLLMSRAGSVVFTKLGPLEAVYVPFGLEAPAEFDCCHTIHLSGETRVRKSEYDAVR